MNCCCTFLLKRYFLILLNLLQVKHGIKYIPVPEKTNYKKETNTVFYSGDLLKFQLYNDEVSFVGSHGFTDARTDAQTMAYELYV